MKHQKVSGFAFALLILFMVAAPVIAGLHLEGQSGVFLNTLAYTNPASRIESSTHYVNLDKLGTVSTYSLSFGAAKNIELGYTRVGSSVTGVKNQDVLLAKWLAVPETRTAPAFALWGINRSLTGGSTSADIGVSASKIVPIAKHTAIFDLGFRSTKALGLGLFGFSKSRKVKFEGSAAVFITPKLIVGTEFKQQIGAKAWTDIALRYIASDRLNIDAGLADLGPGLGNQLAFAATWGW